MFHTSSKREARRAAKRCLVPHLRKSNLIEENTCLTIVRRKTTVLNHQKDSGDISKEAMMFSDTNKKQTNKKTKKKSYCQ